MGGVDRGPALWIGDNRVCAFKQHDTTSAFGSVACSVNFAVNWASCGGLHEFGVNVGEQAFEFAAVQGEDAVFVQLFEQIVRCVLECGKGIGIEDGVLARA